MNLTQLCFLIALIIFLIIRLISILLISSINLNQFNSFLINSNISSQFKSIFNQSNIYLQTFDNTSYNFDNSSYNFDNSSYNFDNSSYNFDHSSYNLQARFSNDEILSRKKRYILFPDGSTFTAAVCSTQTVIGSDTGTAEYTESFVWALVYDLPSTLEEFGFMKYRKRRDVYETMAHLLNRANINGDDCILKSLCEIHQTITPKFGIIEEILRLIFTIPKDEEHFNDHVKYMEAQTIGKNFNDCDNQFPNCPISLLQMLLGLQIDSFEFRR